MFVNLQKDNASSIENRRRDYRFANFGEGAVNELPPPDITLEIEDEQNYARQFRKAADSMMATSTVRRFACSSRQSSGHLLSNHHCRGVAEHDRLDASYPIRRLEKTDATLEDAEQLPFCQVNAFHSTTSRGSTL
jgi:hypothetical protein